jgi:hypothetical protein
MTTQTTLEAHTVALPAEAVHVVDGRYLGTYGTADDLHYAQKVCAKQRNQGKSPRLFFVRTPGAQRRLAVIRHIEREHAQEFSDRRAKNEERASAVSYWRGLQQPQVDANAFNQDITW